MGALTYHPGTVARTSKIRKPPWEKISRAASTDFEKRGNFCRDLKFLLVC